MVKKLKTFHTSEFPVCSFCKTWRFFTATSKQPLDYSKFVKYQPKYLKSCTQFLSQLSFLQREMLGDFYCRVYNWSKPPTATPRKCMYCAFTCINSKHFIHQKNSESLATIPISWYVSITTGRIVNLWGRGDNERPLIVQNKTDLLFYFKLKTSVSNH